MANRREKWTWWGVTGTILVIIWVIGGVVAWILLPWASCVLSSNYLATMDCSLYEIGRDTLLLIFFWVLWFLLGAGISVLVIGISDGVQRIVKRFRSPPGGV
jgi:hypothetical protein